MHVLAKYSQIQSDTYRYARPNTVRYSQIQSNMNRQQKCICYPYVYVCAKKTVKIQSDTCRYALQNTVRYMQIHADT